jgi:DnaJ-class molecular chaperone
MIGGQESTSTKCKACGGRGHVFVPDPRHQTPSSRDVQSHPSIKRTNGKLAVRCTRCDGWGTETR